MFINFYTTLYGDILPFRCRGRGWGPPSRVYLCPHNFGGQQICPFTKPPVKIIPRKIFTGHFFQKLFKISQKNFLTIKHTNIQFPVSWDFSFCKITITVCKTFKILNFLTIKHTNIQFPLSWDFSFCKITVTVCKIFKISNFFKKSIFLINFEKNQLYKYSIYRTRNDLKNRFLPFSFFFGNS